MSRNRMKNSQSLHWMGVVKWVLIASLLSVLGLSYMLCKNQNLHLAEETHRLEIQLNAINKRNNDLSLDLEGMKSWRELERRLARMNSTLVHLDDPRLVVVRLDVSTTARVARMGTQPNHYLNFIPPVATTQPSTTPVNP